jgi:hypothetical protein
MFDKLNEFYLDKEEPNRSCLLALRSIILEFDPLLTESLKYGLPCFSYKNKMCCYLWIDKKTTEPYILLVEGKLLTHEDLETGDRKKMKIYRINPNRDIEIDTIQIILKEAIDLYRNGIVKTK